MRPRGLAGLLCLLLVAAGCGALPTEGSGVTLRATLTESPETASAAPTPTPTPIPDEPDVAPLEWAECDDAEPGDPFECATLVVPLDHDDPEGASIEIGVVRLPAPPAAERIGSLVINPGGPGGSGVDWVRSASIDAIPAELRARFDVVGFDPRGVGTSEPIECGVSPLPDVDGLDPRTDADRAEAIETAQAFAAACEAEHGDLLAHVDTIHVARDLDLLRAALGDEKLTFLGYSYGTYIGATYAELFGHRVRALVLDGAVDPTLDVIGRAEGSVAALELALDDLESECLDDRGCPLQAALDDHGSVAGVLARLDEQPATAEGLRVDAGVARVALLGLLRDQRSWPFATAALASAVEGDGTMLALAGGLLTSEDAGDAGLGALLSVTCADLPQPSSDELFAAADRIREDAPRLGAAYLTLLTACAVWPVSDARGVEPATSTSDARLLVVGTTRDAVTPYSWSVSLAEQLGARLLTRDGAQHTAFGGDNVCTDRAVTPYLIDLVLPPEGWSCG